jgi:hypothetical protein
MDIAELLAQLARNGVTRVRLELDLGQPNRANGADSTDSVAPTLRGMHPLDAATKGQGLAAWLPDLRRPATVSSDKAPGDAPQGAVNAPAESPRAPEPPSDYDAEEEARKLELAHT